MPAPGWLRLDLYQAWPKILRPQGRPRTRCRDYISQLAREHLGIPHKELESVSCDKEVWVVILSLLSLRSPLGKAEGK